MTKEGEMGEIKITNKGRIKQITDGDLFHQ